MTVSDTVLYYLRGYDARTRTYKIERKQEFPPTKTLPKQV